MNNRGDPLKSKFIAGSRGSRLALIQTRAIIDLLQKACPRCTFTIRVVKTEGDKERSAPLAQMGGQGVFVKELEEQLLSGSIDLAVHSLKDMPVQLQKGLKIGAFPIREDARDVLITRSGVTLSGLPSGSKIGTGSPRRAVQLRAVRPDLQIHGIRGNVDTRLKKMRSGEVDAIILAAAALHRMGWADQITEYLDPGICLPAVGQGSLAIEIRSREKELEDILLKINHIPTSQAVTAERALLAGLGGGCHAPIAAHARVEGQEVKIEGMVASANGSTILRGTETGPAASPADSGKKLADYFLKKGAAKLLEKQ
ncbi:MAG: hydroxymethylbilane synthase [Dehalococcoidia bacterium]|nr:hydroxymethylbilane synthase [Dehalococcoidia bacterium]